MRLSVRVLRHIVAVVMASSLTACQSIDYGVHIADGHLRLLAARKLLEQAQDDPELTPQARQKLQQVPAMRAFAQTALQLSVGNSYAQYSVTGRRAVTWALVRTPEFSLEPNAQCFAVVGCLSYRGFFDQQRARSALAEANAAGDDADLRPVIAYSTLGWFDDPVLDTMLVLPDAHLAGLLFHELAHQRRYFPGNTALSESFATFVEREGVYLWLQAHHDEQGLAEYRAWMQGLDRAQALMRHSANLLDELYTQKITDEEKRKHKARILKALRATYLTLREQNQLPRLDGWFREPINNARLSGVNDYYAQVDKIQALYLAVNKDFTRLYAALDQVAAAPVALQAARLQALTDELSQ